MSTLTAIPAARSRARTRRATIHTLGRYRLTEALPCVLRPDGSEWLATTPAVGQVYGLGATESAAVASLERELASLYDDLTTDPGGFTPEWAAVRSFLAGIVATP